MHKLTVAMLLVLAGTVCAIAQEQEVIYKVGIDSESIAEAAEALEKYMDGPLGRYYAAAVRRQVIIGRGEVVGIFIAATLGIVMILAAFKGLAENADYTGEFIFMLLIGIAVFLATLAVLLGDALPRYAAPEFYATTDILQSLH